MRKESILTVHHIIEELKVKFGGVRVFQDPCVFHTVEDIVAARTARNTTRHLVGTKMRVSNTEVREVNLLEDSPLHQPTEISQESVVLVLPPAVVGLQIQHLWKKAMLLQTKAV